jgi:hypothetical protein
MSTTDFQGYLTKQIEARSSDSGRRIRTTAQTIRTVADQLRSDPNTAMAADFAERGADFIDRIGAYIEQTPLDRMMADAELFSRRRPWVVATAGLAAGIMASRVVKSTAARRAMPDTMTEPMPMTETMPAAGLP